MTVSAMFLTFNFNLFIYILFYLQSWYNLHTCAEIQFDCGCCFVILNSIEEVIAVFIVNKPQLLTNQNLGLEISFYELFIFL